MFVESFDDVRRAEGDWQGVCAAPCGLGAAYTDRIVVEFSGTGVVFDGLVSKEAAFLTDCMVLSRLHKT